MLAVSFVIAFGLTWVFWKEEQPETSGNGKAVPAEEKSESSVSEEKPAAEEQEKILYAPVKGNVIPREEIPDETFASGVLGDGVGIEPEEGLVVAPFDGEISSVTDTRHAVGITGPGEMEVLIHVGVNTVNMQGDGFTLLVKEGDRVKAGQKLLTFDIDKIKAAGYSTTTAVLVTNSDDYESCTVEKTGKTELMEKIIEVH